MSWYYVEMTKRRSTNSELPLRLQRKEEDWGKTSPGLRVNG